MSLKGWWSAGGGLNHPPVAGSPVSESSAPGISGFDMPVSSRICCPVRRGDGTVAALAGGGVAKAIT